MIDPKQVHFKGLKLLGEQLKDENTQDSFVLVEVYDNLDAVKTWRKSLNKRTRAEQNVLVMHHVGKYMKKPGSTINEFTAYLGGFGKVLLYQTFTY
ncbi:MAG: hypothetical protein JOZ57_07370 [Abitibacteriaceae bacterium]|nr:hypothetical protein [Abditibacteriaceae bacterium]